MTEPIYEKDNDCYNEDDYQKDYKCNDLFDLVTANIYETISHLAWDDQQLNQTEEISRRVSVSKRGSIKSNKGLDYDMDIDHESFNNLFMKS